MGDVSAFRDNFAKLNVRNLQKVPNLWRRNFGSELYGFVKFAKINARNLQKVPNRWHQNFGQELYGFVKFVKRNIIDVSL